MWDGSFKHYEPTVVEDFCFRPQSGWRPAKKNPPAESKKGRDSRLRERGEGTPSWAFTA